MSLHRKKKPEVSPEGTDNFNEHMKKRTQSGSYVKGKRLIEQQKAFDTKVSEMKAQLDTIDEQLKTLSEKMDKIAEPSPAYKPIEPEKPPTDE